MSRTDVDIRIRPYRDDDETAVLELLTASLGGGPAGRRPPEFFRWKHLANPFGRSLMLVAEADGRLVGLRAFMRWRFSGSAEFEAVRAVDTATHPAYQGRGIFSRLTLEALDALRQEGVHLVFNTPNEKSLPGYLKMGWRTVGSVPVFVHVRRPARFVAGLRRINDADAARSAPPPLERAAPAGEVLDDPEVASDLLPAIDHDGRLSTVRDLTYLRWRYGNAPLLDYRAVGARSAGRLTGIAIFRVRPRGPLWEATVCELIVRSGDRGSAAALLRDIGRCVPVDHLTWTAPAGWTLRRSTLRTWSVRAPGGMTMVANPLRDDVAPDPLEPASWALTLGDLEVF